ncbi:cytochrome P450 [Suillus weaverae]|nr:cytochrome P450 [Suillus weaverae]
MSVLPTAISLVAICAFLLVGSFNRNPQYPLPPGPPRRLLVGNLLDIPRFRAWHKFLQWKDQYGDVVYAEALGNSILILNTIESVTDLLVKKPSIYSDRPIFTMAGELMTLDNVSLRQSMPMLQYGTTWREHRKLSRMALSPDAVKRYHRVQEDIIAMYMPSKTAGRIIMSVSYGLPVQTPDDLYITDAEETMDMVGKVTVPGAFWVDLIPCLKYLPSWIPFNKIHQVGSFGRQRVERMIARPFEHVLEEMAKGVARPSFVYDCLKKLQSNGDASSKVSLDLIRWAAGTLYGAGGESTYATILIFILAMALYPEVQIEIRRELSKVVGLHRLPSIEDRDRLPYVSATVKEAMRWSPALPLGIARRVTRDDHYRDDKSGIPSERFAPERFLQNCVKETAIDPYLYAFGFGRRECPGKYLGENNLFLLISYISATVEISSSQDTFPEPFSVEFTPVSHQAVMLIKEKVVQVRSADQISQ